MSRQYFGLFKAPPFGRKKHRGLDESGAVNWTVVGYRLLYEIGEVLDLVKRFLSYGVGVSEGLGLIEVNVSFL